MTREIKILQVEDEVITAMLLEMELKNSGYLHVFHVTSGEEAITMAKQILPDIILMDIRLAGTIDGIDAAAAIKAEREVPIIFVTGYEDLSVKERAASLNPLGYLIKPLEISRLKYMIQSYFV